MAKGKVNKKMTKKKPLKTLKEKRKAKRDKKNLIGDTIINKPFHIEKK
jgi:hypothetical protein